MLPTPLHLSTLGFRMAGYAVEQNLRIARVLTKAALDNNPFLSSRATATRIVQRAATPATKAAASEKARPRKTKPSKAKPAAATRKAATRKAATRKAATPAADLSKPAAGPARSESEVNSPAARPEPVAKLVSTTPPKPEAAPAPGPAPAASKRPRQPSAPPQMPARTASAEPKAKA